MIAKKIISKEDFYLKLKKAYILRFLLKDPKT